MKNNRSLKLTADFVKEHQLSTDEPPKDSLFWKLWNNCLPTAEQALQTKFVQEIKNARLDPVVYGGFNVSDAYYCFHGAEDYLNAANKADEKTLKAFLLKKYNSYKSYNDTFPSTWHIKDADGIVPTKACAAYAAYESSVANNEDPIYCLIVMLPCEYLWAWLGGQLSPPKEGNLYAPWINGNNSPKGAYTMGNFLEDYRKTNPIDEEKAQEIYATAMNYELENFISAFDK